MLLQSYPIPTHDQSFYRLTPADGKEETSAPAQEKGVQTDVKLERSGATNETQDVSSSVSGATGTDAHVAPAEYAFITFLPLSDLSYGVPGL